MFTKLIALALVIAAVGGGSAWFAASGGSARSDRVEPAAINPSLRTAFDDRSGQTLYRLGDHGLWMQ